MKSRSLLIILPIVWTFTGAWKSNFRLTSQFNGNGTDQTPLEEKDYAYLFCENDGDAEAAQHGKIDWARSKSRDYCWNEHKGSDDTWRSGWERSRLMRGCENQLNMFGNRIFRCYDLNKDPGYLAIQQSLADQQKQAYADWLKIYNAKIDELNKGIEQTYGDVDAQLKAAQDAKAKAEADQTKMSQDTADAKRKIGDLAARYASMDNQLAALVTVFDNGLAAVNSQAQTLLTNIQSAEATLSDIQAKVQGGDQTFASLAGIQNSTATNLDAAHKAVCTGSSIGSQVETLRSQVAYMDNLVNTLATDAGTFELPSAFASDKTNLIDKISSLHDVSEKRGFIYDASYDLLSETPPICDKITGVRTNLAKAVALAQRVEELKQTVGVIRNMDEAIKQVAIEKEADFQYQAALNTAQGVQAKFTSLLQTGRVSESKAIIDNIDQTFISIRSNPELLRSAADQNKLTADLDKIKTAMLADAGSRLSLDAAHALLTERLRQIKVKIMKLEIKARKIPALNSVWSLQKVDIYSTLNTKPGQDIIRPVFTDWSSLLNYEQMLSRMESVMDQLSNYNS